MANEIKKLSDWWTKNVKPNPYWILLLAVFSVKKVVKGIIETIQMIHTLNISELPIFSWDFVANVLQVVTVYVLYRIYKGFLKAKKQVNLYNVGLVENVTKAFEYTTANLNHSHSLLDKKIRFVALKFENQGLDNDEFIRLLNENGFSKEVLAEIGISEKFIIDNSSRLLPNSVIEKYKSFKDELAKYLKDTEQK